MASDFKCQIMLKFLNMTQKKIKKKVQVIVLAQDNVLLLKLAPNRGGFWQNITGGVDEDESFEAAALRELWEETGIKGSVEYVPLDFEFDDRFGNHAIEKIYVCRLAEIPSITISDEHQEYAWKKIEKITKQDYKYETNFLPIEWLRYK